LQRGFNFICWKQAGLGDTLSFGQVGEKTSETNRVESSAPLGYGPIGQGEIVDSWDCYSILNDIALGGVERAGLVLMVAGNAVIRIMLEGIAVEEDAASVNELTRVLKVPIILVLQRSAQVLHAEVGDPL